MAPPRRGLGRFIEMTLAIRRARFDDLADIVAMLADDALGSDRETPGDPLLDCYRRAFAAIDGDPHHELVVAESGGRVIATLQLSFLPNLTYGGGWRAQIEAVRVARGERGRGIGAEIIGWAIERARQKACVLVQLTTDKKRPGATRFYRSLGFEGSHEGMKLRL